MAFAGRQIGAVLRRGRARGDETRALLNRAVAIDAIDFDGIARFSVEFAVAVTVLLEVAVDAVHPFFQMDVLEVHRLPEFVGIVERNRLSSLSSRLPLRSCLKTARKIQP